MYKIFQDIAIHLYILYVCFSNLQFVFVHLRLHQVYKLRISLIGICQVKHHELFTNNYSGA